MIFRVLVDVLRRNKFDSKENKIYEKMEFRFIDTIFDCLNFDYGTSEWIHEKTDLVSVTRDGHTINYLDLSGDEEKNEKKLRNIDFAKITNKFNRGEVLTIQVCPNGNSVKTFNITRVPEFDIFVVTSSVEFA